MCLGCSAQLRRQWKLPPLPARVGRYRLGGELARVAAMAVMVVGVVLAARPLDDVRLPQMLAPPPQTVLVPPPPATVDEEPTPSLAVADVPRRARSRPDAVLGPVPPPSSPRAADTAAPAGASYLAVIVAHTAMPPVPRAVKTLRFPSWVVVASLAHAGLAEQTP
jgi:hypothetical protein